MTDPRIEIGDLVSEAENIWSLASVLATALIEGSNDGRAYGGAAYLLQTQIYEFAKKLKVLEATI